MDIEKSFTFPFEDKEWASKLGLAILINLVPILNFAWYGYIVGIMRNVMNDVPEPLPTWDDLGKKFTDGLFLFAASLVYALPILIVFFMPLAILAFSGRLSELRNLERISEAGGIWLACIVCVFVLYSIALSAILILFSREGTFASCFKLRAAFDLISGNMGPFFTAWGLSLAASFGVGLVIGLISTILGLIPCLGQLISLLLSLAAGVYIAAVYAHLFGQFGRAAFGQSQLVTTS